MKEAYKHRLIGAGLLAAVAVLFLPSFFKDQQQYAVDTHSQIPQRPTITAVEFGEPASPADDVDVAIVPAPVPDTMFLGEEDEALPADLPGVSHRLPSPGVESAAVDKPTPVPQPSLNAQGLPDTWILQLVSLSNREAATRLRDRLQADGYKAFVRTAATEKGEVHRVQLGPFLSKDEAQRHKKLLDQQLKGNALVLPFKP